MIPASIRNRNPGACYPGPSAKKFGSTTFETLKSKDGVHKIATFPSDVHGAAALFDLLHEGREPITRRLRYRDQTLRSALKTWCGDYYLPTYIKVVTQHCDVGADDVLSTDLLRDPQRAIPLAKAMALQEAGKTYPLDDHEWLEAHEMAFGEARAPGWTPKNDVPTRNPEDRMDAALSLTGKLTAASGGGVIAAAPLVPGVPAHVTQTVMNLSAWSQFVGTMNPRVLLVGGITFAAAWMIPWVRR